MSRKVAEPKAADDILSKLIATKKAQAEKLLAEVRELEAYLERMTR